MADSKKVYYGRDLGDEDEKAILEETSTDDEMEVEEENTTVVYALI